MAGFVGEYAKLINLCRKLLRPVIWESIPGHHTNVGSFVIASLLDGSRRQDSVPRSSSLCQRLATCAGCVSSRACLVVKSAVTDTLLQLRAADATLPKLSHFPQ